MSEHPPVNPRILIRLIEDIYRLCEIIQISDQDTALKEGSAIDGSPIQFHYLVDTPIFQYYAEPHLLAPHVSALPILHSFHEAELEDDDLDPGDAQIVGQFEPVEDAIRQANALLTAEFIFGPAFNSKSQNPASDCILIAPEHVPEIARYISVLEGDYWKSNVPRQLEEAHRTGGAESAFARLRRRLERTRRVHESRDGNGAYLLAAIRQAVIDELAGQAGDRFIASQRLIRLLAGTRVANATSNAAYTRDIIAPSPKLHSDWVARVRTAKRRNKHMPTEAALDADGATLAQLSLLNENWRHDRKVFILISDDRGLHRAYHRWMDERTRAGMEEFYALRYCRQYTPILNISDMGGSYRNTEIYHRIRSAVFSFTKIFDSTDFNRSLVPLSLGRATDRAPSAADIRRQLRRQFGIAMQDAVDASPPALSSNARVLEDRIREISGLWVEAMGLVVTGKADVLGNMADQELRYWDRLLKDLDFNQALTTNVDQLADAFDASTFAGTILRYDFWALKEAATDNLDHLYDHGRRVVASEYRDFQSPGFEGRTVEQLTEALPDLPNAVGVLSEADDVERLFVLGALCLEIGAWAGAVGMLAEADERLKRRASRQRRRELRREVKFFGCVVRRVQVDHISWFKEYSALDDALDELRDTARDDDLLDRARIEAEQLALEVSRFAWTTQPEQDRDAAGRGLAVFRSIWKGSLGQRIRQTDLEGSWRLVQSQVLLNILVLTYWVSETTEAVPADLAGAALIARAMAKPQEGRRAPHTLHLPIYPDLAQYAMSHDPDERADLASSIAVRLREILARDMSSGFAFDIANVDKAEYEKILKRMEAVNSDPIAP